MVIFGRLRARREPSCLTPAVHREAVVSIFPNLPDMPDRCGMHMSGGEQQMLTVARTLMGNPLPVALDEPSEGVAPVIVEQMANAIVELKKEGLSLMLSEQNIHFAELGSDRVYVLESCAPRSGISPLTTASRSPAERRMASTRWSQALVRPKLIAQSSMLFAGAKAARSMRRCGSICRASILPCCRRRSRTLAGFNMQQFLAELTPAESIAARHTVGLVDTIDGRSHQVDDGSARALGYAGVSSKCCKGLYKSILNAARCRKWNAEVGGARYFMSGEDLTTQAGLAVQQDLALVNLLGLTHVERNGHHYVNGMAGLPRHEQDAFLAAHPDLYEHIRGAVRVKIGNGRLAIGSLARAGFASGAYPDWTALGPLDSYEQDARPKRQGYP